MTKEETGSAIALIKTNHKAYFEKMSHQEKVFMLDTWHNALQTHDYNSVCSAIHQVLKQSKFVPKLNEILSAMGANSQYRNAKENNCTICDATGMLPYTKEFDYGGKVGTMDVQYFCRCSCNSDLQSTLPTFEQVFGFPPTEKPKNVSSDNILHFKQELRKWIANIRK